MLSILYKTSYERNDKSTQVDKDIAVQESGQVTSDGQIEETLNDSSYERNDKSTQVDRDIPVQKPCQVTSNGQTDARPHESSDHMRDNSGDRRGSSTNRRPKWIPI